MDHCRQRDDLRRARSGHRRRAGRRAQLRRGGDAACDRRRRCGAAGMAGAAGEGPGAGAATLVRGDQPQRRRPGADDHRRVRQAAGRSEGRGGLRRVVRRVVRRGRQARLRRNHPGDAGGQAAGGDQAGDRRLRGDHAVEFPAGDDHAQGRTGAGRRLYRRRQARRTDAADGAGAGGAGRGGRLPGRRLQRADRRPGGDRWRTDRQPGRAEALLHRLDRSRPPADGADARRRSRSCRSNWAAMRPSSSSTTPMSMPRSTAR